MATALLLNEFIDGEKIYNSMQEFIIKNGIVGTSASIIVGIATVGFIRSASSDLIMPLLNVVLLGFVRFIHKPTWEKVSRLFPSTKFELLHFWHELITWVVMLVTAYFLLQYILKWSMPIQITKVENKDVHTTN